MPTTAPPTLVVVNPVSAGGRTRHRWPQIREALRGAHIDHTAHLTVAPGDATTVTREAILHQGIRRVVAVGGDGTLNEVVNGCFDERGDRLGESLEVGVIPSGSGADFRRTLGMPHDPDAAARLLAGGATRQVDIGRITFADGSTRHFVNVADCGIGGEVAARVNRSHHKGEGLLGTAVFLRISLATLLTYRNREVTLNLDGEEIHRRVQQVVVANGRYFGGGMHIAPGAEPDDGLFDVVIVRALSKAASLAAVPRLYRGTHLTLVAVEVRRARSIQIAVSRGEPPTLFDLDGEQVGSAPASIVVLPRALRIVAPPQSGGSSPAPVHATLRR
jgi:YegS/Rv2252/BmrU family lipid kinase